VINPALHRFTRLLMAGALLISTAPGAARASSYVVGAGDQLFVDFPLRGTPSDLQPLGGNGLTLVIVGDSVFFRYEAMVAPDGFISLPSMDPIRVAGLTLEATRTEIMSHLKTFSLRDTVSVILGHPNSEAFVVTGEVHKPGRFIYARPTTLMEALAMAGGTTDHARLKDVMLFRPGQPPRPIDMSYKTLRRDGPPDIALQPADSIVVPRRWYTPDNFLILLLLSIVTTGATVYVASKS
jgi:polysaccharide export outer membrane protein